MNTFSSDDEDGLREYEVYMEGFPELGDSTFKVTNEDEFPKKFVAMQLYFPASARCTTGINNSDFTFSSSIKTADTVGSKKK